MLKTKIRQPGWKANLALCVFSLVLFLAAMELTLFLTGFNYSQFPKLMNVKQVDAYINYQKSHFIVQHFIPHKKRMWAAKPNHGIVNGDGYIGGKIPVEREPGFKRILFLGGSCTAGSGYYPDITIEKLKGQFGVKAEPLIAAVGGYSTYQGLNFLMDSIKYNPDALVSYFGWNDHWAALGGLPDNEYKEMTNFQMAVNNTLSKLRAFQLLHYMIYPPHKYSLFNLLEPRLKLNKVLRFLRVPPKYFVSNITKMINIAKEHNIKIYFIAPPMGTHIQEVKKDYLLPTKFIPLVHKYYINLLKDAIAGNPGAELIDFENIVFDKSLIMGDGIHPNARGHELIAEKLVRSLMKTKGLE